MGSPRSSRSRPPCRSRCWASTPTTAASSSTTTCSTWCEQPADHLHPVPAGQQQRRCHVEQKNWADRPPHRRLLALRHPRRARAAEPDLDRPVPADQPVHPATEARLQDPHRRQGHQTLRHRPHALPATPGIPRHPRPDRREDTRETLRHPQPGPGPPRHRRLPAKPAQPRRPPEHHPPRQTKRHLPHAGKTR